MIVRLLAPLTAASFLILQCVPQAARAENRMGYQLLSAQEAAGLPQNGGKLGLEVERAQQITDDGMTFDIMRVKTVRSGSAGEQAGFTVGDQIIAVDGRVFPTIATFAAYIGAMPSGRQVAVDYMPARRGPQQAQRVNVTIGPVGNMPGSYGQQAQENQPVRHGMSTGTKVAIGAGAVALLGCYEAGCFTSHHRKAVGQTQPRVGYQQPQPQAAYQQH